MSLINFTPEYTWERIEYLVKRMKELERKQDITEKEMKVLKRYRKEFAIIVARII